MYQTFSNYTRLSTRRISFLDVLHHPPLSADGRQRVFIIYTSPCPKIKLIQLYCSPLESNDGICRSLGAHYKFTMHILINRLLLYFGLPSYRWPVIRHFLECRISRDSISFLEGNYGKTSSYRGHLGEGLKGFADLLFFGANSNPTVQFHLLAAFARSTEQLLMLKNVWLSDKALKTPPLHTSFT